MKQEVTIIINNSYSQITGLTTEHYNGLRKVLSYSIEDQMYFSRGNFNARKYLIDKHGTFPTGLMSSVKTYIKEKALKCSIIDARVKPTQHINLVGKFKHKPYAAQIEASECVKYTTATLSLPTGSGKSMVIALILNKLKLNALIVVPTLELKKQLTESLNEIFGNSSYITVENIDSANLQKNGKYDVLILDEAHRSGSVTYQKLNKTMWKDIYYRFFLTATAFRSNPNEDILFRAIAGDVKYELSYKDAVKMGFVAPMEAYYVELPKIKTDAITWQQVYSELVVNNEERNNTIARLMTSLVSAGLSTLCLVKEVKHGSVLSELTNIPFANGQDDTTRSFIKDVSSGKITGLIGTEGICAEGVDTRAVEFVIIAALGKAKGAFLQKCGRAIRIYPGKESAKVIIFKDLSHRFTAKHYREQVKILKDYYGIIPQKLDF